MEELERKGSSGLDHEPRLFRLPADRSALQELLRTSPGLQVFDELVGQLQELVRSLNPSVKYTKEELHRAAMAHVVDRSLYDYGVWVHYPWSRRLVHLLDEQEFALVRTDRNRNKITREEQALLATKKIGVIGLSVGQSVSLTMALERCFGEIRLADHDDLELSNLNRIRSGVHNLGLNKVINVAREIAEIDPFLKVTCLTEGITRENIDRFFTEGGTLDLLVEECDSVDIKIIARQKAKEYRVPVVMETSDRGMIDVERFDLEPQRPILHGLVDHLDLSKAASAKTNEEKLPFVIPIVGIDTMSKRMKASMIEIESSVTTWPQLASGVALGGALVTDIVRRILLGQFTQSGRWFADPEDLMPSAKRPKHQQDPAYPPPLTLDTMLGLVPDLSQLKPEKKLTEVEARQLAEAGTLAPSAGNLQPWRFLHLEGRLFVFHDPSKGDSLIDGGRLIPALDMGACLENIQLKARRSGITLDEILYPVKGDDRLVAVYEIASRGNAPVDDLVDHVGTRCTNRKKGVRKELPVSIIQDITRSVKDVEGCDAHIITDPATMDLVARIVGASERIRLLHPIGHYELFEKELRYEDGRKTPITEGLDLDTLELKLSDRIGMIVSRDREAMDLVTEWNGGGGFMKSAHYGILSSSGMLLISAANMDPRSMIMGGRAMERGWLAATRAGLSVHPTGAPILLGHHVRFGGGTTIPADVRNSLLEMHQELVTCFDLGNREPMFMMRLAFADAPTERSLRRPLDEVFCSTTTKPA